MGWGWQRKGGRWPGPRSALDTGLCFPLTSAVCAVNSRMHPSLLVGLARLVQPGWSSPGVQVGFNPAALGAAKRPEVLPGAHQSLSPHFLTLPPKKQFRAT